LAGSGLILQSQFLPAYFLARVSLKAIAMNKPIEDGSAPSDLIELGRIVGGYGVQGWVKIQPHSAQAEVLQASKTWWLARSAPESAQGVAASAAVAHKVLKARPQGSTLVAQLAGIDDRDVAEAMRGTSIYASRSLFPKPDQDEYYWVDLIGCSLYGEAEDGAPALIGAVLEVLDNGAHGILRVGLQQPAAPADAAQPGEGADIAAPVAVLDAKGRQAETLVPFVRAHVHKVDLRARRIDSDWPVEL
jgi:16S rRNA processing protein RimM